MKPPSIVIFNQYFYPSEDITSRHYTQFAEELTKRGWKVTVVTSNRLAWHPGRRIPDTREDWQGIRILRCYQPPWDPARRLPRLVNSLWMLVQGLVAICRTPPAEAIIIGTLPALAALLFPTLRLLKPGSRLAHWVFDLYPEAIVADGAQGFTLFLCRQVQKLMASAYRRVDLLVDIGACMRRRLAAYQPGARAVTLTPWALVEPGRLREPDPEARRALAPGAKLVLLYSGTMGRAHDFEVFLELARRLARQEPGIAFCFACRGNRYQEFLQAIRPSDKNVVIAPFVGEEELEQRLIAADLHLLSLRPQWQGVVVPSKFFGSLAVGRPVIYAGPADSAIAGWIREYEVGLVLNPDNLDQAAQELAFLANHKERLAVWQENALQAYQQHFSKKRVMDRWDAALRALLAGPGW